ncbi:MAG: 6-hydroxymethylpterin diphosphokinase MptE-like protein [Planctomycetota bacterium]
MARLREGANDRFNVLIVVGWHPAALHLLRDDPVTRDKRIAWILRPEDIGALVATHRSLGHPESPHIALAAMESSTDLVDTLDALPICWGLCMLPQAPVDKGDLLAIGRQRWIRRNIGLNRLLLEHRHALGRMDAIHGGRSVAELKGSCAGWPCIAIAAGPSLDKRLEWLRQVRHRCKVIACDAVYARLVEQGIIPDFILTVDHFAETVARFPTEDQGRTTCVLPIGADPVLDEKFVSRAYFAPPGLDQAFFGFPATFPSGSNVGATSIGLAHFLGCREIVLLGHDLSRMEERTHSPLTDAEADQTSQGQLGQWCRKVPANGGGHVMTTAQLEIGIADLEGMIASLPDITVRNPNIDDGIGACIGGAVPLPGDWPPPARPSREQAEPGPPREDPDVAPTDPRGVLLEEIRSFREAWQKESITPANAIPHLQRLFDREDLATARYFLEPVLRGHQMHLMRLRALPPAQADPTAVRQTLAGLHAAIDGLEAYARCCNGEAPLPPLPPRKGIRDREGLDAFIGWTDSTALQRFCDTCLHLIQPSDLPSAEAILSVQQAVFWSYHTWIFPHVDLPDPRHAIEGLLVACMMGPSMPPAYLTKTLCLCALEGLDPIIELARSTGLIAPDSLLVRGRLPACDPRLGGAESALAATDALLTRPPRNDRWHACFAWPPAHIHAIRHALGHPGAGVAELERRWRNGDLAQTDCHASTLVLHHPVFEQALELLKHCPEAIGEATIAATAQRRAAMGDRAGALRLIDGSRPLSALRDDHLAMACEIHLSEGRITESRKAAHAICDRARSQHHQIRIDLYEHGPARVLSAVPVDQLVKDDAFLAELLKAAWQHRDGASIDALIALIGDDPRLDHLKGPATTMRRHC